MRKSIAFFPIHPCSAAIPRQPYNQTSSSAIRDRPRCRVGQFWPKVEYDILQTL